MPVDQNGSTKMGQAEYFYFSIGDFFSAKTEGFRRSERL